jgi:hypothetical protein
VWRWVAARRGKMSSVLQQTESRQSGLAIPPSDYAER